MAATAAAAATATTRRACVFPVGGGYWAVQCTNDPPTRTHPTPSIAPPAPPTGFCPRAMPMRNVFPVPVSNYEHTCVRSLWVVGGLQTATSE